MNTLQRIENIIFAAISIACAICMCAVPKVGYLFVVAIIAVLLLLRGIRKLIYYFTMAKYMVGGKFIFYIGIIMLDLGLFMSSLFIIPMMYVMIYLVLYNIVCGGIEVIRALESKSKHGEWKFLFIAGLVYLGVGICCIIFIQSLNLAVYLYSIGMIFDGIRRIVNSLRRSASVYVQ